MTLIPSESKKLISQAVARMSEVQEAFKKGIVAVHPSSSTVFIAEELHGKVPETDVWVCGIVGPRGTCAAVETAGWWRRFPELLQDVPGQGKLGTRLGFPFTWVFIKGKLQDRVPLGKLLDMMGPGDIYIKGVNAVDPNNNVGVLTGDQVEEGGTFGSVVAKGRSQGFTIIFPVGLEKLIPVPIREAAREAGFKNALDYSMGMPCTLVPCPGIVVTEPRAIELLTGATATPISAGGLIGAEGALTMVIKGDDDQVTRAIAYVEGVKGTQLPRAALMRDCVVCEKQGCSLRGGGKHWC